MGMGVRILPQSVRGHAWSQPVVTGRLSCGFLPSLWLFRDLSAALGSALRAELPHGPGNGAGRAEPSIPAGVETHPLCFQRSECDCQVYKRLFMFGGVRRGARARSGG